MNDQRGQATPLLALVVVAIGGLTLGLARFGVTTTHAARSQAAADAAALAGAAEDRSAADVVAAANGAEVLSFEVDGRDVEVRARVGDTWAVARARRVAGGTVGGWVGRSSIGGVAGRLGDELRSALADAARLLRQPVPITAAGGRWVDVPHSFAARLAEVGTDVGLCRRSTQTDPVRFDLCPRSRA